MTIAQIINICMSSVAEDKLAVLFISCRKSIPAHHSVEEMDYTQPPTPMQTDNTTAHGIVTNNIAGKRQKHMDMRLH